MFDQNLFFLAATGASASGQQASSFPMLVTFGLVIVVMYVFLIRPQSKKQKAMRAMLANLKKGDRIITIGGIYGTIVTVKDNSVVLKVDKSTELEIVRENIARIIASEESSAPEPKKVSDETPKKTAK